MNHVRLLERMGPLPPMLAALVIMALMQAIQADWVMAAMLLVVGAFIIIRERTHARVRQD